jgi:hypothetical protein
MGAPLDCLAFVWLLPVTRGAGTLHYIRRDVRLGRTGPALCGELGNADRYGVPKWRVVRAPASKVCGSCQAAACREPTRIDWSGGPS